MVIQFQEEDDKKQQLPLRKMISTSSSSYLQRSPSRLSPTRSLRTTRSRSPSRRSPSRLRSPSRKSPSRKSPLPMTGRKSLKLTL
jgi:hypothetical protein